MNTTERSLSKLLFTPYPELMELPKTTRLEILEVASLYTGFLNFVTPIVRKERIQKLTALLHEEGITSSHPAIVVLKGKKVFPEDF